MKNNTPSTKKVEKSFPWYDDRNNIINTKTPSGPNEEKKKKPVLAEEDDSRKDLHEDFEDDFCDGDCEDDFCEDDFDDDFCNSNCEDDFCDGDYEDNSYGEDYEDDSNNFGYDDEDDDDILTYNTPRKIYEYLDSVVWKQDEAKKAAAICAFNTFVKDIRSNMMFIGPTGCGKTHTFRMLQKIFPDRILIVDASNITSDGWKGEKKFNTILEDPIFRQNRNTILVFDEADKMLTPKFSSHGENVSQNIASEALKLMEGTDVRIKCHVGGSTVDYMIDTSRISFVFCGAFSNRASEIAETEKGCSIGFGSHANDVKAYDRELTGDDIIEFGVMPEFMGRIQRIVNLKPMTRSDYIQILESGCGPVARLQELYGAEIRLSKETREMLAEQAMKNGLGIRGIENGLYRLLDDAIFEDCNSDVFEF